MSKKLDPALASENRPTVRVNPDAVKLGRNSREGVIPGPEAIYAKAVSIALYGQQSPCLGHKEGDDIVLDAGFTRLAAVQLLRTTGVDLKGEKDENNFPLEGDAGVDRHFQDAELKLWVAINPKVKTAEDAYVASVSENIREDVSPLSQARAFAHLRDSFGWTKTRYATLLGYNNTNHVSGLEKLLQCDVRVQEAVGAGKLSLSAAVATIDLPKTEVTEVLKAVNGGKKVTRDAVAGGANRGGDSDDDEGEGEEGAKPAKPRTIARNAAAVKELLLDWADDKDEAANFVLPENARNFLNALVKFVEGTRNAAYARKTFEALLK